VPILAALVGWTPWICEPGKSVYALMRRVSCLFMRRQQQTAPINLCISHYSCVGGPRPSSECPMSDVKNG